jgi:hypothetical protein
MKRKSWKKPRLIILTRPLPEDGVLQQQVCKFRGLDGPGADSCTPAAPGIQEQCFDLLIS